MHTISDDVDLGERRETFMWNISEFQKKEMPLKSDMIF